MEQEEDFFFVNKAPEGFVVINTSPYGNPVSEAPSMPNDPVPGLLSILGKLIIQALAIHPRSYKY